MQDVVAQARVELLALILASARMVAFFQVLPLLSTTIASGLVRTGILVSLSLIVQPVVKAGLPPEGPAWLLALGALVKEVLLGTGMGFAFGAVFWGIEGAGFFIDNQRGAAIASSIDPLSGSESAPMGIAFVQILTAWIFASGAFLSLLSLVYQTYAIWPVLSFWPKLPPDTPAAVLAVGDQVMRLSILLAGPVFIAMFASEMALALVSRFAPSLNVFVLAMPVKSGVAFFVLVLYLPFLVNYIAQQWDGHGETLQALRRLLE